MRGWLTVGLGNDPRKFGVLLESTAYDNFKVEDFGIRQFQFSGETRLPEISFTIGKSG
jgi:hypothetical protein